MAFIEYLLDNFNDSNGFEDLCSEMMLKEGYSKINPISGTGDKGRDAEEILFIGMEGARKIIFQFSLQKTIKSKVKKTLLRIRDAGISASEIIFIFSTDPKPGERDILKEKALSEFGFTIDIRGQKYLTIRLSSKAYKDIVERFFSKEISQMKTLYDSGQLFASDLTIPDKEKRCLVNLMHYGRHPMAGDVMDQIIREAILRVLAKCGENSITAKEINQLVFDYLPMVSKITMSNIYDQIRILKDSGKIELDGEKYILKNEQRKLIEIDIAEILTSRRVLIDHVLKGCGDDTVSSIGNNNLLRAIDVFLTNLFRKHGLEVANEILNHVETSEITLDQDSIDSILSQAVASWPPIHANRFRDTIKSIISNPNHSELEYMNALSKSYVCMQLMNADPDSINVQRQKHKESVAILDTDVVLTGIVRGSRRQRISVSISDICSKSGFKCFAFDGSIEEIVFRIKKSISLYEDIGCPSFIPPDKKRFISDIFLDRYFEELAKGEVHSFDEFIYYSRLKNPVFFNQKSPYVR